jgi:hypothetical protein
MMTKLACCKAARLLLLVSTVIFLTVAFAGGGEAHLVPPSMTQPNLYLASENSDNSPQLIWSRTFGGAGWDVAHSVIQTSDGGYAIAGATDSELGLENFWFVKTDPSGNKQWDKNFGGITNDAAYCVIQTADGGYAIAGYTDSYDVRGYGHFEDFWLIKTDSSGDNQWSKNWGNDNDDNVYLIVNDRAYSVVQTSDGGYAIAGYTESIDNADFNADFYLVKTDSLGNEQWSKTYGGENDDRAYSVVQTSDGGYAIAGYTKSQGAGGEDMLLIKTDSVGNAQWRKTWGSENNDRAYAVIQTSDGGYVVGGYWGSYNLGAVFFLARTDSLGNTMWENTYAAAGDEAAYSGEKAYSLDETSDGGYVFAGVVYPLTVFNVDFGIEKVSSSGEREWGTAIDTGRHDVPFSVIQTSDNNYVLAGFCEIYDNSQAQADVWLVKVGFEGSGVEETFPADEKVPLTAGVVLAVTISGLFLYGRTKKRRQKVDSVPTKPATEVTTAGPEGSDTTQATADDAVESQKTQETS